MALVLLAWAVAGPLTLAGALCIAELIAMMPRAGGQYNFIDAAFGKVWAFLYGWIETLLDGAASIAAIATVFIIFATDLFSEVLTPFEIQIAAAGTILAVTLLNLASIGANGRVASIVTTLKILLVSGIGIADLVFGSAGSSLAVGAVRGACEGVPETSRLDITGVGAAMVGALWAYNGCSDLSMVPEEVREPGRTIPRAIIGASLPIIVLYLLVNLSYFFALGSQRIADLPENASVVGAAMTKLSGPHRVAAYLRHDAGKFRGATFHLPIDDPAAVRHGPWRRQGLSDQDQQKFSSGLRPGENISSRPRARGDVAESRLYRCLCTARSRVGAHRRLAVKR